MIRLRRPPVTADQTRGRRPNDRGAGSRLGEAPREQNQTRWEEVDLERAADRQDDLIGGLPDGKAITFRRRPPINRSRYSAPT